MTKTSPLNLRELQDKLYERLKPSGWGDAMKAFLLSEDMSKILKTLEEESDSGAKFTPKLRQVFRFMEECPYSKLKLVMLMQDPYPLLGERSITVADGIAMSCGNTNKIQPSLKFVHQEIAKTIYPNTPYNYPMDLKCWSNQGVLLTNIALTTTVGRSGVHYLLWRDFIVYMLDHLAWHFPGMLYVYLGKKAQDYAKLTPSNTYKIMVTHPAYAAHQKMEEWDSQDLFNRINKHLRNNNHDPIKW